MDEILHIRFARHHSINSEQNLKGQTGEAEETAVPFSAEDLVSSGWKKATRFPRVQL